MTYGRGHCSAGEIGKSWNLFRPKIRRRPSTYIFNTIKCGRTANCRVHWLLFGDQSRSGRRLRIFLRIHSKFPIFFSKIFQYLFSNFAHQIDFLSKIPNYSKIYGKLYQTKVCIEFSIANGRKAKMPRIIFDELNKFQAAAASIDVPTLPELIFEFEP